MNLRTQLLNYAAERGLGLETFLTSQGTETLGDLELPSIGYSVVVEAPPGALVGMLNIVEGVQSTRIDRLEFDTSPEKAGVWIMSMDLAVLYAPEA